MAWVSKAWQSSIGAKIIMAISGLMLLGFLFGHIAGNLLIFVGPEAINSYARGLRDYPAVLWALRIGTLVAAILHISLAKRLTKQNMAASPSKYAVKTSVKASFASRTMFPTGIILLVFLLLHLAHYTLHLLNPEFAMYAKDFDAYSMVVAGFNNIGYSIFYIFCMIVLMIHLSHGVSSAFQTLGISHPKYNLLIKCAGPGVATILGLGFISIPVSVLLGILR